MDAGKTLIPLQKMYVKEPSPQRKRQLLMQWKMLKVWGEGEVVLFSFGNSRIEG